ncbi:hypothetical protein HHI36_005223 [Cryptolaemus montrouzieri]|uniref:Cysteine-rich secretory protein domain-containing protein n=1 Tax=Cryptolaemus montrouzieri TaxID=559131 RepID=A0ABD2NV09_9CUCU
MKQFLIDSSIQMKIGNLPDKLSFPYLKGKPCEACEGKCHANRLCTNVCPFADYWSNCEQLHKRWPKWLCHTKTKKGKARFKSCKATCTCENQIHD